MSAPRLYRSLLKTAKQYDADPTRRASLLAHPRLHAYTGSVGATGGRGHALFFLQPHTEHARATQDIVRREFRNAANLTTNSNQALNQAFSVLRAMRGGCETPSPAGLTRTPTPVAASHAAVAAPLPPSPSSSARRTSPAALPSRPSPVRHFQPLSAHGYTASSRGGYDVTPSNASGPALRRAPAPMEYGAHTSILGRLHHDVLDIARPPTPAAAAAAKNTPAADPNHDSQYHQSVFQLSVYAEEYLKQVSPSAAATGARAPSTPGGAASPAAGSSVNLETGQELHLIDASRMRHQHAHWMATVVSQLTLAQKVELEAHVQLLGNAVQSSNLEGVLAFASAVPSLEPALQRALMSNNQVVDAWLAFLWSKKDFGAILRVFQLRLSARVLVSEFGLSRPSLCRVLTACAIEGDALTSVQALRETSWASLARDPAQSLAGEEMRVHGVPSSVAQLPSWVPSYYSSPEAAAAVAAPRACEIDNGPDPLLAASADGYGVESAAAAPAPPSVLSPVPVAHSPPRLTINLHARPLASYRQSSPRAAFSSILGSTLLASATPTAASQAAMSSCARPRPRPAALARPPTPLAAVPMAEVPPPAPTPLPILDLFTELSLDSRLMELALLAQVRKEFREQEFRQRDEQARVQQAAKANPLSANEELNLSIHEHAAALFHQQRREEPIRAEPEVAETAAAATAPETVFDKMNSPSSRTPFAFQLWSLMLQQKIPLQHSHSYVELLQNLQHHLASGPSTAPPRSVSNLLLQTLSSEFQHARTCGALKHKTLRADLERFLHGELAMNEELALDADGADNVFECVQVLRRMQAEGVQPEVESVRRLHEAILTGSDASVGRAKLLQDLLVVAEDSGIAVEELLADTPAETAAPQ